ncbi:hypothetical protein L0222_18150 [bacterium]|nr:hypothetical protein [bacterium]MCI0603033.1 hypothetical protein [bacterium]
MTAVALSFFLKRLKRWAIYLTITVLLLALIEGILAILFVTPVRKYITCQPLSFLATRYYLIHRRNCHEMTYDRFLTYTLKPNHTNLCRATEYESLIKTNSMGLRDSEDALRRPEIVALGDSFTFGQGVDQQKVWPKMLERITGYKVLNAGVSSYGTARELQLLKRLDTSNLKYLILQYHWTDLHENERYIKNGFQPVVTISEKRFLMWTHMLDTDRYYPGRLIHDSASLYRLYLTKKLQHTNETEKKDTDRHVNAFLTVLNKISTHPQTKLVIFTVGATSWWRSSGTAETMMAEYDREKGWRGFIPEYFLEQVSKRLPNSTNMPVVRAARVVNPLPLLTDDAYFIVDDHINATGHAKVATALSAALSK